VGGTTREPTSEADSITDDKKTGRGVAPLEIKRWERERKKEPSAIVARVRGIRQICLSALLKKKKEPSEDYDEGGKDRV